jgi:branched-chain amino acid aminotransferase
MMFLKEFGIECEERRFTRDELYISDEVFLTGTAAEITPIREIDGIKIGSGDFKITRKIQDKFFKVTRAQDEKYLNLLTFVEI